MAVSRTTGIGSYPSTVYTQSSVYPDNTAATWPYMNDNSANGSVSSQTGTQGDGFAYITADVGASRSISKIVIGYDYLNNLAGGWGVTYTEGLAVEGSTDDSNYTSITTTPTYSSTGSTNGLVDITINGTWRYIRLSKDTAYICLLEFQVWTT